jgi:hypothetical protein
MGNKRNFKVGDKVTLSGNIRLTGKVTLVQQYAIGVLWDNSIPAFYSNPDGRLIWLDSDTIVDRVMKKYYGYGAASV